jgi:hypothetical protein
MATSGGSSVSCREQPSPVASRSAGQAAGGVDQGSSTRASEACAGGLDCQEASECCGQDQDQGESEGESER